MDMYLYLGLSKDNASMSVSITLIFLSALLTGLGWYDRIAKHAGAGTLVPITGFANSVAAPALEFKTEGYILGLYLHFHHADKAALQTAPYEPPSRPPPC